MDPYALHGYGASYSHSHMPCVPSPGTHQQQRASHVPPPAPQEVPQVRAGTQGPPQAPTEARPTQSPVQPTLDEPEDGTESGAGSDASSIAEEEAEDSPPTFSLKDAIRRLSIVSPDSVGAPADSAAMLSSAGRLLGRPARGSSSNDVRLKASDMVVDELDKAWAKVRGCSDLPLAGTVPSFPSAYSCGSFLRVRYAAQKDQLQDRLPHTNIQASREDLLLLPEADRKQARTMVIKDKQLSEFEDHTCLALQSLSAVDSFLAGLILSLKEGSKTEPFRLKSDINKDDVLSFLEAVDDRLKASASLVSSLHVNLSLCRRDAILSKSKVVSEERCRASLRSVPPHDSSLFGNNFVSPMIHSLAETNRDHALAGPRSGRSRSPARKSKAPGFKAQRFRSAPAASGRGGKSKGSGSYNKKPYERKQAPKASTKQHPQ